MGAPYRTEPDTLDAIRADLDALVGNQPAEIRSVDGVGMPDSVPSFPDHSGVAADAARTLHLRRQLAAAVDHGADMLAALGLPRLVEAGFVPIDVRAAGDALEAAVAALDALDADPEAEPWLAGFDPNPGNDLEGEPEHDEDDGSSEYTLGAPERHPSADVVTWGYSRRPNDTQERWADGMGQEGEGESDPGYDVGCASEHDGCEPNVDAEPSLGSIEAIDQRRWGRSGSSDAELDDAEGNLRRFMPYPVARANAEAAREVARQAREVRRRVVGSAVRRDPDEVVIVRGMPHGTALWQPAFIRDRHGHGTRVEVAT